MGNLFQVDGMTGNVTTAGSITAAGGLISSASDITLQNQHSLIFDDTSVNSITLHAPTTITSSYTLIWPLAQGAASTFLQNDGSGNLSWAPAGGAAAGANTQVQYNSSGAFAGSSNFTFDGNNVTIQGTISTDGNAIFSTGSGDLVVGTLEVNAAIINFNPAGGNSTIEMSSAGDPATTIQCIGVGGEVTYELFDPSGFGPFFRYGNVFNNTRIGTALTIGGLGQPDASAVLDIQSTTKGMLLPRMSTAQRNSISSPATGLQIFNTSTNEVEFYNGSVWAPISVSGVTSITGTANQVIASASTGAVTLSLPQSINTTSSPSFLDLTITDTTSSALQLSQGGGITLTTATAGSTQGGNITLTSGEATNTGTPRNSIGGNLVLTSGNSDNGNVGGGSIILTTGTNANPVGSTGAAGGSITLTTGSPNGFQNGGSITLTTSNGGFNVPISGGSITLTTGSPTGTGASTQGGSITLTAGTTATSSSAFGGNLTLTSSYTQHGGSIVMTGTGSNGTSGSPGQGNIYGNNSNFNSVHELVSTVTTTHTAGIETVILANATSAAFTVTLPAASTATNRRYSIKKTDSSANAVTVQGNASENIDGSNTQVLTSQYQSVTIICDGTSDGG